MTYETAGNTHIQKHSNNLECSVSSARPARHAAECMRRTRYRILQCAEVQSMGACVTINCHI